ncbi:hypothetical protein [Actinoplanes rectilineatus]|uniref:hypothetical protein n=1 Tax=Actinoplanes rectilineatus TaxID=113571 RepID=UPI0005F2D615|nr:hypothetical protein [Actinoplanes rectilineatus]
MPGPPPDPEALRRDRNSDEGWHVLPLTGRPGPAPDWPLTPASNRESHHWVRLWKTPQATRWEVLGQHVQVAMYVRRLVALEDPDATAALGNHVIRLEEALGLSIPGMRRNRWQIGSQQSMQPAPPQAPTGTDGAPAAPTSSARGRMLRAVPNDGA